MSTDSKKIYRLDEIVFKVNKARAGGKRVVHCHGVFDLLHLGHIRYFKQAKSLGDILVVTITPDRFVNKAPSRPAFSEDLRAEAVDAINVVDFAAINEWPTAVETIKLLRPDLYVKGSDYKDYSEDLTDNIGLEEDAVNQVGGEIAFTTDIAFSSSALINQHLDVLSEEQKRFIDGLKKEYDLKEILGYLDQLTALRVLTVGEAILDEYVFCEALGKSGKEPVLVMQSVSSETYSGGILAVANHVAGFCGSVEIVSFLGENGEHEEFIKGNLNGNMKASFCYKTNSPTIVKRRFIDNVRRSKLLGVYDINDEILNRKDEQRFFETLDPLLPKADMVIVADYGHGVLTDRIVDLLLEKSRFITVNAQVNAANIGYHTISRYKKANCIVVNETELRHEFRSRNVDVRTLAERLGAMLEVDTIVVTRGKNGAFLYDGSGDSVICPAFASRVVDIVGAGDALLALTSVCLSVGMPSDLSLFVGCLAAAQSVEIMGNSEAVSRVGVIRAVESVLK